MTLFFHLKASTERQFRETAMKKFGFTKGSLKSGLEEAIGDWLIKNEAQTSGEESTISKTNENQKENKEK